MQIFGKCLPVCFGEYIQYLMDIKIGMWLVAGPGPGTCIRRHQH